MRTPTTLAATILLALTSATYAEKEIDRGTALAAATAIKTAQAALKTCVAANNRPPTIEEMRDWKCLLQKTDAEGKTIGWLAEKPTNPINNSTIIMSEENPKNVGGWTYKTDGKTCTLRLIVPTDYAKQIPKLIDAGINENEIVLAK